jgi:DNA-binding transcriptional LysR family regulator
MNVREPDDRTHRYQRHLDMRQLVTFHAVATLLSFTRAAGQLGYVQSSVTAQVQALERDLGVRLFERLGRTITLTDAGKRLLPYAEQFFTLSEEARHAVDGSRHHATTLVVAAPDTLCAYRLPAILRAFRAEHPSVHVVFRPIRSAKDARRLVLDGTVDLGIVLDDHPVTDTLAVTLLRPEPLCLLVAPDHPLAPQPRVTVGDLHDHPVVLIEHGCGYRDFFDRLLTDAGVATGSRLEFASIDAVRECVKAGMGLTILPRIAIEHELAEGALVELAWTGPTLEVATMLMHHRDKWLSSTLTTFLAHALTQLGPQRD